MKKNGGQKSRGTIPLTLSNVKYTICTVPAESLGRYKKVNIFFPVIYRPLKESSTEKGLYIVVWDDISLL